MCKCTLLGNALGFLQYFFNTTDVINTEHLYYFFLFNFDLQHHPFFIQIYQESDKDTVNQRKVQSLKSQLEKERNRRNKLLELLEEDIITKQEFKERNGEQNVFISQLEEELFALENSVKDESDYFKSLQDIKKMFKKMYDPDSDMDKDAVDNLVKTLVDRIDVVPVTATEMRLEMKIKVSSSFKEMTYIRNGLRYGARSGNIVKKMVEAYENSIK